MIVATAVSFHRNGVARRREKCVSRTARVRDRGRGLDAALPRNGVTRVGPRCTDISRWPEAMSCSVMRSPSPEELLSVLGRRGALLQPRTQHSDSGIPIPNAIDRVLANSVRPASACLVVKVCH